MADQLWKVALRGTHPSDDCVIGGIEFSSAQDLDSADGLLHFCALGKDILSFPRPKAWYIDEPITMSHFRTLLSMRARSVLGEDGFFHHTNPNPEWRVLSPTHCGRLDPVRGVDRLNAVVAAVNNYGGRFWWVFRGNRLRNRFILHDSVQLFGSKGSWQRFKKWPWARRGFPLNYMGETSARWWDDSVVHFLSGYKVVVCMENSLDSPHYFTEKFINAVRAGCIPVFHARPEVKKERLQGAKWVDPADFDFDPEATLNHALGQDIEEFQNANDAWLGSPSLAATHRAKIWERIAELFRRKLEMAQCGRS